MAANAKPAQAFHTKKGQGYVYFTARRGPCGTKVPGAAYSGATEATMSRIDPWEKAADCERALRLTLDPVHRANLTNIREFWISLANERPFLSEHEFARQAEAIGRLHASLAAPASIH
jgi:hypothetical protein